MRTTVRVEQFDSSGYKLRPVLSITAQMEVEELVKLFLAADYKKQQKILTKLRK